MKKALIAIILIAGILTFMGCVKKVDIETEKTNIKAVLDQKNLAFEKEDMALLSSLYANTPDLVVIGSAPGEHFVGWGNFNDSAKKRFEELENTKITVKDLQINVGDDGKTAWFTEIFECSSTVKGKTSVMADIRATGVLSKIQDKWVIVQCHSSIPFVEKFEETMLKGKDGAQLQIYTCAMHPDVLSDKAGKCQKCGMDMRQKKMESGKCPKCGAEVSCKCPKCGTDMCNKNMECGKCAKCGTQTPCKCPKCETQIDPKQAETPNTPKVKTTP